MTERLLGRADLEMEEGEERIRQAYGVEKYERLKALKSKYDAENFFRLNQHIPPA